MAIENRDRVRGLLRRALDDPGEALSDLPELLAATEHGDRSVRAGAAWAICAVASERPDVAPAIRSRLEDRSSPAADLASRWIAAAVEADDAGPRPPGPHADRDRRGARPPPATSGEASPTAASPAAAGDETAPAEGGASDPDGGDRPERPEVDRATHEEEVKEMKEMKEVEEVEEVEEVKEVEEAEEVKEVEEDDGEQPPRGGDGSDRSDRSEPSSPATTDAVVENERFTIPLDRTGFDSLEVVDRVASDRHSWTYVGMATVDADRRAVLIRTYRPPRGARLASFASAFEEVLAAWDGVDDHAGVLTVHDYGRRPHPWIVTDYAAETLRSAGRLPLPTALRIGLDAATALAHAHDRGVTHGSLDPRSVALDNRDDRPVGRLLNFGVVDAFRAVDGPLPLDSRYGAPELFGDGHGSVDWLTDVYHLGATLYTAFTGKPPYEESLVDRGGPAGVPHVPPSNVADGIPIAADRIVAKAMATHKIARYESADELARDLRSALDDHGDG